MTELFNFAGMALDGAEVLITDAIFAFDPEYNDGQTLRLELTAQSGEVNEVIKLGVGKGWTTTDGETAFREDGREGKSFHKQTATALLVNGHKNIPGLIGLMNSDKKIDTAVRAHAAKFPQVEKEAGFWKGLQVTLQATEVDYGGEIGEIDRYIIAGFQGWEGEAGSAAGPAPAKKAAAPAKKAAKKAAAATKAPTEDAAPSGGMTDEIRAKLDLIADGATDHSEFMEQAIAQVPEASSDDAVIAEIKREDEGSIWDDACNRYDALQAQAGEG